MPNVYDFDKTIAYRDGGAQFLLFCFRRHTIRLLRYLPGLAANGLHFLKNAKREKKPARGEFYRLLRGLPDWQEEVRLFWAENAKKLIKPWYLAQKKPDDIVISCSPDFLLEPICEELGVQLISTKVNTKTGKLESNACYGAEKVRRLREAFGSVEIDDFYSDSLSDGHLARLAKRAWLVKGDELLPWPL